ncbi:DASS family sodium-coupled anion symporter [Vibrio parahaemolyticus]|jgi:sodium-dependent dicarboxylate transporter 2/3/5|uniref:DASS family sodium-coupled anion symporter n=2 Tax=Vibrio parahaemolyticus TaxID=670 RepID=A0A0L7YPK9_VIBPH|nr:MULTISPECIES: DASS family sodium-coupled anion symporter [Vibrio]EFO38360.1 transporter, NadC family [Vibrio parahaemolyticus Peru-466]EFO45163.1 transporter, NadC family [Vibrio parahaemolyticus AQ4037]EFO53114.1 transporter, NadC family [Vibrio parahaemolyticus K5030]EJG0762847.1 DASS family sodium-coupled anion symporter [Vibrio parahaemolyticus O5:K30]EJG0872399.1 DASS family sodium-coupled anion symporter [Vibrio parahaemolyticus O3]EJG0901057.1 DASS family sodium-coupled anion sympor
MTALAVTLKNWFFTRNSMILNANILLFIILFNTLPFEPQVVTGISILVFVAILWLTEAIHVSITALLIPMLAVFLGVFNTQAALNNFSNSIIFLFLGGFALAAALHKQKLDQALADKVLLIARGRMSVAVFMLFGVSAGLSMWISNTATAAMMLPLVLGVMTKLDAKKNHNTFLFVLLGIAYSASIGGIATLVGSPPNAIAAAEVGLNFTEWMKLGLPISLILMPIAILVLYTMTKPDLSHKFELDHKPVEWTNGKMVTLAIFLLTVTLWIFSKPINTMLGGFAKFDTLVAIGAILLLGASRAVEWKDIEKTTDWGVLILFGGGICLSNVLKATGTSVFLAHSLTGFLEQAGVLLTILSVVAFVVFLTEFASNTASAALLVPVFATIAEALGLSPVILSALIAVAASCAFMLPVATPPNAIVFGTGHIKQKEMMRIGFVLNIACIGALTLFAWLFW